MRPGLYLRSASVCDSMDQQMLGIGVCREGVDIMLPKMRHFIFMARALDPRGANILKQEMLAVGGEAAISYGAISDLGKPTDCLISGTERQLRIAIAKLELQPFGLRQLASELTTAMGHMLAPRGRVVGPLTVGKGTLVMGILNLAPDSFSGDGITEPGAAVERALEMERQGASIIDIGGESTRPGAERPSRDEEMARVIPVIRGLKGRLGVPISIDSRDPAVIEAAAREGASIINLVGGIRDREMAELAARLKLPVILMHMQGEPGSMQDEPTYADVMDDIVSELREQVATAMAAGIAMDDIILDPGIGFGKTLEHNLEILRRIGELRILGLPILVGASRKSFIGKVLCTEAGDRLEGSLAAAVLASTAADILRAHDVRETVRALRMADAMTERERRPPSSVICPNH